MRLYEYRDLRRCCDEVLGELGKGSFADHDEQSDAVAYHGSKLVRLVTDSGVVADGDPAFSTYAL